MRKMLSKWKKERHRGSAREICRNKDCKLERERCPLIFCFTFSYFNFYQQKFLTCWDNVWYFTVYCFYFNILSCWNDFYSWIRSQRPVYPLAFLFFCGITHLFHLLKKCAISSLKSFSSFNIILNVLLRITRIGYNSYFMALTFLLKISNGKMYQFYHDV